MGGLAMSIPYGSQDQLGWRAFETTDSRSDAHWLPMGDIRKHVASKECWCEPREGWNCEWFHNAADDRERYEEGFRKPH